MASKPLPPGVVYAPLAGKPIPYKDNKINQRLGLVGKTYIPWRYQKAANFTAEQIAGFKKQYEDAHPDKKYPTPGDPVEEDTTDYLTGGVIPMMHAAIEAKVFKNRVIKPVVMKFTRGLEKAMKEHATPAGIRRMIEILAEKTPLDHKVTDKEVNAIVRAMRKSIIAAKKSGGLVSSPFYGGDVTEPELLEAPLKK